MADTEVLRAAVLAALDRVMDPCSVNAQVPLSLIDMGLLTKLHVAVDGTVTFALRATTPMCTLIGSLLQGADRAVGAVPGVRAVQSSVDHRLSWSEDAMTAEGRALLHARRATARTVLQIHGPAGR